MPAAPFALVCATASLGLALASADRPRRLLWSAAAAATGAFALSVTFVPTLTFDLRHGGPLDPLRAALAEPIVRLIPEPEAGLVLGIVLGERASVGSDLIAAFNATGTTHLLAISGFNLTLVASAVALAMRGRLPPAGGALVCLCVTLFYAVLVGLQPSVLRAALMAAVGAVAVVGGRPGIATNALCAAAAAMLLLDPASVTNLGAQLSVSATLGLILWQRALAQRMAVLPALVREGLAATLAATAPTLPLLAAALGRISLVAPLANLFAVPLFTPLLAFGAAASLLGAVSPDLARPVAFCAFLSARLLRIIVEAFSGVPFAALAVPPGAVTGLAAASALAAAVVLGRRLRPLLSGLRHAAPPRLSLPRPALAPIGALVGFAVLLSAIVALPSAFAPDPAVRVRVLDVGQGDAFLVDTDGRLVLIDGGPDPARLLAELGATLPPWRRRIDVIALTHAHLDHGAGLLAVLDRYEVGIALEPAGLNDGPLKEAWTERIRKTGTPRRALHAGERLRIGAARIAVLAPHPDLPVDVPSLVLRLERDRFSALFMGDATDPAIAALLLAEDELRARVYVPPHHGASTRYAAALVGAVRPERALMSVGAGNRYGHPAPDTLAALAQVETYRTDRDGTVEVASDGIRIGVRTHANGLPPPRRGSVPYAPAPR